MNIAVGQLDRQTYLGGSDVAAVLGLSPYRTPLDVYLDKVDGSQPVDAAKAKIEVQAADAWNSRVESTEVATLQSTIDQLQARVAELNNKE